MISRRLKISKFFFFFTLSTPGNDDNEVRDMLCQVSLHRQEHSTPFDIRFRLITLYYEMAFTLYVVVGDPREYTSHRLHEFNEIVFHIQ